MVDRAEEPSLNILKQVWRRQVFRISVFLGVLGGILTAIGGASVAVSLVVAIGIPVLGGLLDLIGMLESHDLEASKHYEQARARYETIERYQAKMLVSVVHDIEQLITQVTDDVNRIVSRPNQSDLFTKLIALDLGVLRDRLSRVKADDTLTLDTHQAQSHVVICEVIEEEHIDEISIIYDLRDRRLGFHDIDWYFANEVDRLIQRRITTMKGLFILRGEDENCSHDQLLEKVTDRDDLHKLLGRYKSAGYECKFIGDRRFREICQKLFPGVESNCDLGIYGTHYVYIATGYVAASNIPRGEWKRGKSVVARYAAVYRRCWEEAIPMA